MIRKGRIIGLFREPGSGLAMLAIDDERRGKVLIPCEGNPTARAFDEAFGPGFIVGGHSTDNSVIQGEEIYYTLDSVGVMETFTIAERAPIEMVEEYESQSSPKKGTHTRGGFLPGDHPLYGSGPIVSGRPTLRPPKLKPSEFN